MARISRVDIETMPPGLFTDYIVDLTAQGGDVIIDRFRIFLSCVGPCAKDIGNRWHALAILIHLYMTYGQMTPEVQGLQSLFVERLHSS